MAATRQQPAGEYISTETGNRVSRRAHIHGLSNIILSGKTIIHGGAVIRGDLRRAGATGPAISISAGKYCVIGEGAVVRPSYKTYKGVFSYYPLKLGDFTRVGQGALVEAATVGVGVDIGKNAIIVILSLFPFYAVLSKNGRVRRRRSKTLPR